jgi:hypothetical protein
MHMSFSQQWEKEAIKQSLTGGSDLFQQRPHIHIVYASNANTSISFASARGGEIGADN